MTKVLSLSGWLWGLVNRNTFVRFFYCKGSCLCRIMLGSKSNPLQVRNIGVKLGR